MSRPPLPLGEIELLTLLAVRICRGEGYGYAVALQLWGRTPCPTNVGTVYKTLRRLTAKGLLRAELAPPRPVPGGRRKNLYSITPEGEQAARATLERIARVAKGARLD